MLVEYCRDKVVLVVRLKVSLLGLGGLLGKLSVDKS
jgi:hypothetical protein